VDFAIREQGVFHGHFAILFPPLYHVVPYLEHNPFRDLPFAALRQTIFLHIELEVASWICARHSAKIVPSAPIPIASRTLFLKWFGNNEDVSFEQLGTPSLAPQDTHGDFDSPDGDSDSPATVVSWMLSLNRRPDRWAWGRAAAARAGFEASRWLALDGQLHDVRSCIDVATGFARGFDVATSNIIQPYSALACAVSHQLLHRAVAVHGAYAGLAAPHLPPSEPKHGPGMNSPISCDAILFPVTLNFSVGSHVDWVVVLEDDLLPIVSKADVHSVMSAVPLNFDLVWLGHCPCNWNGPSALPGQRAPVASVRISRDRVVQLWRGAASCLHAYAFNPSSAHITASFVNLFDGVQWKPACEGGFLRCLVAVVVQDDASAHVVSINGLQGMFDQNKELLSDVHNAPL
jgi:hypothetical protein